MEQKRDSTEFMLSVIPESTIFSFVFFLGVLLRNLRMFVGSCYLLSQEVLEFHCLYLSALIVLLSLNFNFCALSFSNATPLIEAARADRFVFLVFEPKRLP